MTPSAARTLKSPSSLACLSIALLLFPPPPIKAETGAELRDDKDHRYRLVVTTDRESVALEESVPTKFCLSPRTEASIEVCLGRMRGHGLFGADRGITRFLLLAADDSRCTCARPVLLTPERPVCWSSSVQIADIGADTVRLSGFVSILEDARQAGEAADSCVRVNSEPVELKIRSVEESIPLELGDPDA